MLVVPFSSDYDQRFTTQFADGNKYTFDARWNERGQVYTFDITRDKDQTLLIAGIPVLAGQDILAPYALGIGGLVPMDLSLKDSDPGPDDFAERVIVVSFSNDELAALDAFIRSLGRPSTIVPGVPPPLIPGDVSRPAGGPSTGGGGITQIITVSPVTNTFNVTGGLGFGTQFADPLADVSGNEVLIGRFAQLPGLNPNPTVALTAAVIAGGAGTVRIYTGGVLEAFGSVGTPSGSLRDSAVVSGEDIYDFSASFANPGGSLGVKVTMQSAAPATEINISSIGGAVS